jgi:hypothetical protein
MKRLNEPKTYAIVEEESGKVVIYQGIKQYYRTKATAVEIFPKIKKDLMEVPIKIIKLKPSIPVEKNE